MISLSLVAGVRSSRCDRLRVGVGRHTAHPLRSSKSLSFTTRSWNNNKNPGSLFSLISSSRTLHLSNVLERWRFHPFLCFSSHKPISPSRLKALFYLLFLELDLAQPLSVYMFERETFVYTTAGSASIIIPSTGHSIFPYTGLHSEELVQIVQNITFIWNYMAAFNRDS